MQADSLLLSHWESSVPGVCRHPVTRVGGGAGASCTGHSCFRGHFKNHGLANFPGLSSAFPMLKPRMELRGCGGCYIRASCLMEAVRGRSLWIGEQYDAWCVGPSCTALSIGVNPSLHLVLIAHDLGLSLQASVPDDTVTVWPAHTTSWQSPCFTPEPDSQEPDGHQRMN